MEKQRYTTEKILLFITAVAVIIMLLYLPAKPNLVNNYSASKRYVGNLKTKKLHDNKHLSCRNKIKHIEKKFRVYFRSKQQAYRYGYHLCKSCN